MIQSKLPPHPPPPATCLPATCLPATCLVSPQQTWRWREGGRRVHWRGGGSGRGGPSDPVLPPPPHRVGPIEVCPYMVIITPPPHRVGPIVHDSFSMRKQPKPATKRKRKAVARKQRKQGPPTPTSRALPFNHHHHHHHHHHLQQRRTGGSLKQQRRQPASLRTKKLCLPRPSPPCTLPALGPTRLVLF